MTLGEMTLNSTLHAKSSQYADLRATHVLQFEELLHEDLVNLDQNHIHAVTVDQGQVPVTLRGEKSD